MLRDEISEELKKNNFRPILDALVAASSRGTHSINGPGFMSSVLDKMYYSKPRSKSIEDVYSALTFYESKNLIILKKDKIEVNESALKYASKNLDLF